MLSSRLLREVDPPLRLAIQLGLGRDVLVCMVRVHMDERFEYAKERIGAGVLDRELSRLKMRLAIELGGLLPCVLQPPPLVLDHASEAGQCRREPGTHLTELRSGRRPRTKRSFASLAELRFTPTHPIDG